MIIYSSLSRPGNRSCNEDTVGSIVVNGNPLLIVADGLGGHGAGDQASQFVVEQFISSYFQSGDQEPGEYLNVTFQTVQNGLIQLQEQAHCRSGMKSTAVVVIWKADNITIGNIGDSRAYLFGRFGYLWRTTDQSVPQMLALAGKIREKEIRHHPDRNKLLHALGDDSEEIRCEITRYPNPNCVRAVLLCSDGFWENIDERQMAYHLHRSKSPEEWLERMEKIVLRNGRNVKMDNYSAVAGMMR